MVQNVSVGYRKDHNRQSGDTWCMDYRLNDIGQDQMDQPARFGLIAHIVAYIAIQPWTPTIHQLDPGRCIPNAQPPNKFCFFPSQDKRIRTQP